jgi:short subunit dehydrogenase-like uncharacterized protein
MSCKVGLADDQVMLCHFVCYPSFARNKLGIDTRVVNRSNAVSNFSYGKSFVYSERQLHRGLLPALLTTVALAMFQLLILVPVTRSLLKRVLPKPGQGPSQGWSLMVEKIVHTFLMTAAAAAPANTTHISNRHARQWVLPRYHVVQSG